MELSIFFNHILLALGFTVYKAGVRVRPRVGGVPSGDYMGWCDTSSSWHLFLQHILMMADMS